MHILTVVGARPQFIKAAALSRVLRGAGHREFLIHTGQHYDDQMSQIFFTELELPKPDVNLEVGSGSHGFQTGRMLIGLEEVIQEQKPDWVLVYGDTNSTLAGALVACKLRIPLAHVEAGLRSFNREMPEEHNRRLTDHCSDMLFCPTQTAVNNLASEGISSGVHLVGDVMLDALSFAAQAAQSRSHIMEQLGLASKSYLLATVHRAENTDNKERLSNILGAFDSIDEHILFPVHPRTRKMIDMLDYKFAQHVQMIDPVGYLDMLMLEQSARMILTDSGGIQKEAYCLGTPCLTLRTETEWIETIEAGWNRLVGTDLAQILAAVRSFSPPIARPLLYGDGHAAEHCVTLLNTALL